MLFSKAIQGFILSKQIEGLSSTTLEMYQYHLNHFCQWLNDPDVKSITPENIKRFFYYLQTEYEPKRWNKKVEPLTNKTLRNVWIVFKSFWTWGQRDLSLENVMATVLPPKFTKAITEPFSKEEVKALLGVLDKRKQTLHTIRDKAIILVLLDTGIRASELCMLSISDYNAKIGRIEIRHGKGDKRRFVHLGVGSRKALWKYLATREDSEDSVSPLFAGSKGKRLDRNNLGQILSKIATKAGLKDCYPHKFRHTFAIEYLRNGGDLFTLQELLGHSSLEMVRHYSKIASIDTQRVHMRAGPVDNWLK